MSEASLIVSIVAIAISAASLSWNVLNYLWTGQKAELRVSKMEVFSVDRTSVTEPFLHIKVGATGRVPIEVIGWSAAFPNHTYLHSALLENEYRGRVDQHLGEETPKMIHPGSAGLFALPLAALEAARNDHGLNMSEGHIEIYFAARKTLRDKKSIAERLESKAKTK